MDNIDFPLPLLGIAAWSGTGKTTLLKQVIPLLKEAGINIALVKHAHHNFDIDYPGKDSYELRKSGADQVIIASAQRMASIIERQQPDHEPHLGEALSAIDHKTFDLVLIEGFKQASIPKIELHRIELGKTFIYPEDKNIIALAIDAMPDDNPSTKHLQAILDLNNPQQISDFIIHYLDTNKV